MLEIPLQLRKGIRQRKVELNIQLDGTQLMYHVCPLEARAHILFPRKGMPSWWFFLPKYCQKKKKKFTHILHFQNYLSKYYIYIKNKIFYSVTGVQKSCLVQQAEIVKKKIKKIWIATWTGKRLFLFIIIFLKLTPPTRLPSSSFFF